MNNKCVSIVSTRKNTFREDAALLFVSTTLVTPSPQIPYEVVRLKFPAFLTTAGQLWRFGNDPDRFQIRPIYI